MNHLFVFYYGLCMGVAEAIPGVNGATIALLFGIYKRIIDGIQQVLRLKFSELPFFLVLVLGNLVSIWVLSGFVPELMRTYPEESNALIFGLMLVAILIPYRQVEQWTPGAWFFVLITAVFAFLVTGLDFFEQSHSNLTLFIVGAIGACGLLLPGLSGSYLLKILGQYEYVLDSVHQAFKFDLNGLQVVFIFILGMVFGIAAFSKLLSYALKNYHSLIMAAMTGLTIGGLRPLFPELFNLNIFGLIILGILLMGSLIYLSDKRLKDPS